VLGSGTGTCLQEKWAQKGKDGENRPGAGEFTRSLLGGGKQKRTPEIASLVKGVGNSNGRQSGAASENRPVEKLQEIGLPPKKGAVYRTKKKTSGKKSLHEKKNSLPRILLTQKGSTNKVSGGGGRLLGGTLRVTHRIEKRTNLR